MMKSEREDLLLQQQVFDKITKTARDEDDFSIHMIEEVSIQRLKASVQSNSTSSSSNQVAFPPSGMTSCLQVKSTSRQEDEPTNRRSSPRSSGASKPASRRHQSRNRAKVSKSSSTEEQRRHRRNKRVISEVRKRVQEAHLKSGQSASGLVQTANQNMVPQAYRGRKLVYTRGGQVPQYRNGELDWNYLWFFSDSSSSATTSNSSANSTTLQQQILFDQSATSNSDQSGESASSSGDSLNRNQLPVAPPPTIVNSQSKGRSIPHGGVMRQATKKRIRRLAANPPADDNIKLLGMV